MSLAAEKHSSSEKAWFRKRKPWIIAAIVLLLLVSGVVILIVSSRPVPEIGGGLMIEADPGTRIYAGDKRVGTTRVTFILGELFGDERHSPVAEELPDSAPGVTAEMLSGEITAEMLSGAGATKVSDSRGMAVVASGTAVFNVKVTQTENLMRRADGSLDHVFILLLVWSPPNQPSRSYLLPIRLRKGSPPDTVYFGSGAMSTSAGTPPRFMRIFGRSPNETKTICRFSAKSPPAEFAEEIKAQGLWEPSHEK
jgi:hypothetical protein